MARKDIPDKAVVQAAADFQQASHSDFVNDLLVERTGQPLKVCDRAIERAINRGLVECGTSERSCWPTPKGWALLTGHPL